MHKCRSLALFLCDIPLCIFMVKLVKDSEVQEVETSSKQDIYITMHLYSCTFIQMYILYKTKSELQYTLWDLYDKIRSGFVC